MFHRSGRKPSKTMPQASEPATKTVSGEDPAKMGVRLHGRDEAVSSQREDSDDSPPPSFVLTDRLPHEPRPPISAAAARASNRTVIAIVTGSYGIDGQGRAAPRRFGRI